MIQLKNSGTEQNQEERKVNKRDGRMDKSKNYKTEELKKLMRGGKKIKG